MTIIKLTSEDLFHAERSPISANTIIVPAEKGRYILVFSHLYDNQYELEEVRDYKNHIVYNDMETPSSMRNILLLSPLGYGNVISLKEGAYYDSFSYVVGEASLYFDGIMYLSERESVYFPSKTGDVYIVANLLGGYSVAELPYYEFIEVTQEIKDNIKLV